MGILMQVRKYRKNIYVFFAVIICLFIPVIAWRLFSEATANDSTLANIDDGTLQTVGYATGLPGQAPIGDNQPISRAMTAKMLSLIFSDTSSIYDLPRNNPFTDIVYHHWYAPFANAAYIEGIMRGNGDRFMPDYPLTIGQAQILLHMLDPANAPTFANITDPDKPISYALWVELYKQLLEALSDDRTVYEAFGIQAIDITIIATSANSTLPKGHLISDRGPFGHRGLTLDAYIDHQLRILVKDHEIIALDALLSDQPTLKNVYVVDVTEDGIILFAGGAERFFYIDVESFDIRAGTRSTTESTAESNERNSAGYSESEERNSVAWENIQPNTIADVVIQNGRVLSIKPLSDILTGILLRASEEFIEVKGQGLFPTAPNFQIYDITEGFVRRRNLTHIIVGTDMARFYLRDGVAEGGVITHEAFPDNIRVVIGTSHFAGLIHSSVTVTSTGNFWITNGNVDGERLMELAPGQRFTVSDIENANLLGNPRLFIHTEPNETLQLIGLGRHWPQGASPRYRGVIEIAREQSGYSVVNVLPLEEYLFAVVPSEMPSNFGVEASKVQAVTARSYAVHQIMANQFHALGGNIDDSVMSQVYNNIPENDISIEAVNATQGLVLWYGDEVIRANFFSTSAGMTANSGEVLAFGRQFPGYTPTFLRAQPQFPDIRANINFDLSDENRASAFFRNQDFDTAYDSHAPWFRWQVEMTPTEIADSINAQLATRYYANPYLIRTLGTNGQWEASPIYTIGNLRSMQVVSRGVGGNIMELRIIGDEADILVATEFNIRNLLRPARSADGTRDITLHRHDGTTLLNHSMLPSAFFTFDKIVNESGVLERIMFYGGGHGHGVGMSQNGVKGMVERGYTFESILEHFYFGSNVNPAFSILR